MFKNYFSAALRNLRHNKAFTAINILGLSVGISASLLIFLVVQYDFGFDKFEKGGDRIYRVVSLRSSNGNEYPGSGVSIPLGNAVQNEVTGLDVVAPIYLWKNVKIGIPGPFAKPTVYKAEKDIAFVNSDYFKLIHYDWIVGSPEISLSQPNQTVLTEESAKEYFPNLSASEIIGKEFLFEGNHRFTITGIVKNITKNTDFTFKTFVSRATLEKTSLKPVEWDLWDATTDDSQLFIRLSPGTDTSNIRAQLAQIYEKYHKPAPNYKGKTVYLLQPLSDLHFNARLDNFDSNTANKPTLYGLMAIAAFLLILGCINFINLTTAQASHRAKEIGIRKTLGSSKKQLVSQFLSETFFLTIIATLFSVIIMPFLLRAFAEYIPPGLYFDWQQPGILLFLFILTIFVSFLSGVYPALILSSFRPVTVLKNQVINSKGNSGSVAFRKTLIVSQFVIAQVFIIATIIVSKQIQFLLNKDMGFKKEAIVYFSPNVSGASKTNTKVLFEKLKDIPEIASVSLSSGPPASNSTLSMPMEYKDGVKEVQTDVQIKIADTNYIGLYKIKLLAGINISNSDTVHDLLINETYSKILGFQDPQQAIGKYIQWDGKQDLITGVVADFHTSSLKNPIKPLVIASKDRVELTFNIALRSHNKVEADWSDVLGRIKNVWKKTYPADIPDIKIFSETSAKYYTSEKHISYLLKWATGLAIFISCLGLLGLVMYTTNQRRKEIGIRKLLGAKILQIMLLLSRDLINLVIIAFVIAVPIVWIAANKWLQNFAFKIDLSIWLFVLGGFLMLLLAMIVLLFRTYRAATANPVDSLSTE